MNNFKVSVKIGRRKIHAVGAEHWAIKIGDNWYEIEGTSKDGTGVPNKILCHQDDSCYSHIETRTEIECDDLEELYSRISEWNSEWLLEHPSYGWNSDNCQLYVKETLEIFSGKKVTTQNTDIGSTMKNIGIAGLVASSLGVVAFGVVAAAGTWILGTHKKEESEKD